MAHLARGSRNAMLVSPGGPTEPRKATSAIQQLPAEILSAIFRWVKCLVPEEDLSWNVVTHVCQQWRAIALQDPLLWRVITCENPHLEWLERALTCSRPCALEMSFGLEWDTKAVKLALEHSTRIPHLRVIMETEEEMDDFLQYLALFSPLDALFDLQLTVHSAVDPSKLLLNGRAPNLRRLSLGGDCMLSVQSDIWENITYFSSFGSPVYDGHTVRRLRGIIKRMPRLEELWLNNAVNGGPKTKSKLKLKCLNKPVITDSVKACTAVFTAFKFSNRCSIQFSPTDDEPFPIQEFHELAPLISANHETYHALHISIYEVAMFQCRQAHLNFTSDPSQPAITSPFDVAIVLQEGLNWAYEDIYYDDDDLTSITLGCTNAFSLRHLTELVLRLDEKATLHMTSPRWRALFECTSCIQLLSVYTPNLEPMLDALSPQNSKEEVSLYWRWAKIHEEAFAVIEALQSQVLLQPPLLPKLVTIGLTLNEPVDPSRSVYSLSHTIASCLIGRRLAQGAIARLMLVCLGPGIELEAQDLEQTSKTSCVRAFNTQVQ